MNKPVVFVGDIHGKVDIVNKILSAPFEGILKVFMGDFLDGYDKTPDDCVKSLRAAYEASETRDDVFVLRGNHDLQYINPMMRCSGFNAATQLHVKMGLGDMIERVGMDFIVFDHKHVDGMILASHAGVSRNIFTHDPSHDEVLDYANSQEAYNIGRARGGWHDCGGIFWCDWHEEFAPIEGIFQVVGHTAYRKEEEFGIIERSGNYNVDCLSHSDEILFLNTDGTFSIENLCEY